METTRKLVEFAVSNNYDTLPREVLERAKELILDAVGATVLGSTTPTGKIIARYVKQANCQPEATIMGGGIKATLTQAVFVNGSFLHSTELEADPMAGTGLPAMTIHSSLAAAERFKASGKKILEAFILGYEVQGRIQASSPGIGRRGFLTSMIVCTLGSAASTAKILGFDVNKFSMAVGLAASQASGLVGQSGTSTHFIEMGMAARNGVESALFVKEGITAMPDILENPQGFCSVYAGEGGFNLDEICQDLGKSFLLVTPGICVKKYPCCFRNHRALDAVFHIMRENNISYDQIAEVEVGVNKWDAGLLRYPEPTTGSETKFSLNHSLAAAILLGKTDWQAWSDEAAVDPKFKEARTKVRVVNHPEWPTDRSQSRVPVDLTLKDGRKFAKEYDEPISPTREQVIERYRQCIGTLLPKDAVERSIDLILNLEKMDDISPLMGLVRGREQS